VKEPYLEKIEANPKEIKSTAQQQEVPKEETAVETHSTVGPVWGLASSHKALPTAE
jgi:hypothetical protein